MDYSKDSSSLSLEVPKAHYYGIIAIGVVLGVLISFFDNVFIPFALPLLFTIVICLYLDKNRKIRNAILFGLWVKIFISLFYYLYLSTQVYVHGQPFSGLLFAPDGELYSGHAWWVSVLKMGKDFYKNNLIGKGGFFTELFVYDIYLVKDKCIPMDAYTIGFFTYLIAVIYSMLGYCPLLTNFFNCIFGVLTAYTVYLIAARIFSKRVAYMALVLTLFLPSLFIWSTLTKLREPLYIFLLTLFLLFLIKFTTERRFYQLIIVISAMALLELIRPLSVFMLLPVFAAGIFFVLPLPFKKKAFFLLLLAIFIKLFLVHDLFLKAIKNPIDALIRLHYGKAAAGGGIVYRLRPDFCYIYSYDANEFGLIEYLIFYFKGIFHFWLEPFPMRIFLSKSLLIFCFQQFFWYILLFFFCVGVLTSIRKKSNRIFILLFCLFVISSTLALSEANIGTMVRHRDFITPIVIIFACAGFVNLFSKEEYAR